MSAIRILLVEDHADSLEMFSLFLRKRGYDVEAVGSMQAALEMAKSDKAPFDLLISDITLSGGSGLVLMKELKEMHSVKAGIALSGLCNETDLDKSVEAGFSIHLVKPINLSNLDNVIRDTLEKA